MYFNIQNMPKKSQHQSQHHKNGNTEYNQNVSVDEENRQEVETESFSQSFDSSQDSTSLEIQIESLKAEVEDWKNRAMRATADVQNVQRQAELDNAQAKKSAKKYVANGFLSFLNTLNLAFTFAPQTEDEKVNQFLQTLKGSFVRLQSDLDAVGIQLIVPAANDSFDGEIMTALNEKSADEEIPTVKNVATVGLKVDGQVTTPASVML